MKVYCLHCDILGIYPQFRFPQMNLPVGDISPIRAFIAELYQLPPIFPYKCKSFRDVGRGKGDEPARFQMDRPV